MTRFGQSRSYLSCEPGYPRSHPRFERLTEWASPLSSPLEVSSACAPVSGPRTLVSIRAGNGFQHNASAVLSPYGTYRPTIWLKIRVANLLVLSLCSTFPLFAVAHTGPPASIRRSCPYRASALRSGDLLLRYLQVISMKSIALKLPDDLLEDSGRLARTLNLTRAE